MNQVIEMGHNERTSRLGLLAEDARGALARVALAEADTVDGWLAYGAALNEGRACFDSNPRGDAAFGDWVVASQLATLGGRDILRDERAAAMWAAAFPDEFEYIRENCNARTVRGMHSKWLELKSAREYAEQLEQEANNRDEKIYGGQQNNQDARDSNDVIDHERSRFIPPMDNDDAPKKNKENVVDLGGRDPKEFNLAMHYVGGFERIAKDLEREPHERAIPILNDKERERLRAAISRIDAINSKTITRI